MLGEGKPFGQTGTWLKIAARKDAVSPKGRSGLLASVNMDGEGVWVKAPAYLECRFTAQSAPGTWPAFWTLTSLDSGLPGDELDIIEAYGGMGKGNPNHPGYSIVSHAWLQKNADGSSKKAQSTVVPIMDIGGKSYWSTTFHTYAVYIGTEETVYYFDDIEVFRHASNKLSGEMPHCFLINYAIGGISRWPIDLERYGNGSDMWVDYVRVYAKESLDYKLPAPQHESAMPETSGMEAVGLNFAVADKKETQLLKDEVAGYKESRQANWNNLHGANGEAVKLKDNHGKDQSSLKAKWAVPAGNNDWRSKTGRPWGFEKGNLKLQSGYVQHGGELNVRDIPYARYDVHVYLNADDNTGRGSVSILSSSGDVDPGRTYFYNLSWLGGTFVKSTATAPDQAKDSNMIIFRDNTAKDFILQWNGHLQGGWTGVSAVQIVNRE